MNEPEQGHGQGQPGGGLTVAGPEAVALQGASDQGEEGQGGQEMDGEVEGVVAPDAEPAEGVVDGQGELHQGA